MGGIAVDLSQADERQVYVISARPAEARRLANVVRSLDCRARSFESASAFLDIAPALSPGCVLVDYRHSKDAGLSIPRELKARSIPLPTIMLDAPAADVASAVAAMKAGAIDYLRLTDDDQFRAALASAIAECHGASRPTTGDENAIARLGRLTAREREVLIGLVSGGTNKTIGQQLGISPRTVELHRAQVMNRLNATSLSEVLHIAIAAGIVPPSDLEGAHRKHPHRKLA
jgi:FixJ family two-component response regulator